MRDAGTKSMPLPAFLADQPDVSDKLEVGLQVGRYQLLAPIARGGMAEVWVARLLGDLGFSRLFALKTIRSEVAEDPSFRERFFEEARIAARLRHSNIVEVIDLGEEGSILFQVMTLIEGDSLAAMMRARSGKAFEGPIAARILSDTLAALHAAHELTDDHGVQLQLVHRDVSPHNILVGVDGVSKLTDFGVAKVLGGLSDEVGGGDVRGKPGYVSPEQAEKGPIDRRADIFAAGVVLWELLSGKRLFKDEPHTSPDLRYAAPHVSDALARLVMRALAKDPKDRFQTAAEMGDALDSAVRAAPAKEVAKLVESLCGEHVREIRESVKRSAVSEIKSVPKASLAAGLMQPAAPQEPETVLVPTMQELPRKTPQRTSKRQWIAVGVGMVIGMAIGSLLLYSSGNQEEEPMRSPAGKSQAATVDTRARVETTTSAVESKPRTRSSTPKRERHRPKPKFENPYKK